jgi:DNA polymerase delta subunit 1
VLLHVTDFLHYLYVAAPISFVPSDCEGFRAYLDNQLAQHQPAIHSVQIVLRENLMEFQGNQKSPYIKITVTDPKYINKLRTTIESGGANYKGLWKGVNEGGLLTFDSIQYVLRFMIDTGVSIVRDVLGAVLILSDCWHVLGRSPRWKVQDDCTSRPPFQLPD